MTGNERTSRPIRMLLTGGGTGGHLFPAIASAQKLQETNPGSEVLFVGTKRKMDTTSLEKYDFQTKSIHCYGVKGKSVPELLKALFVLPISCIESLSILYRYKPDVVLGVGGYVTGPVVGMARVMGIPTLIHEQNSIPGLANRKLGQLVNKICVSLPDSGGSFPKEKVVFTGNPVRKEIIECSNNIQGNDGAPVILILGGSQGAHGVNVLVVDALSTHLSTLGQKVRVIHQTGQADFEYVRDAYEKAGIDADVAPFFQDMASLYKEADLVISRAGATTLSELAIVGKAAILIPYPTAADNHQLRNAEYYATGGAVILEEKNATAKQLADNIKEILGSPEKLVRMSEHMKSLSFPDAAEKIVFECSKLVSDRTAP